MELVEKVRLVQSKFMMGRYHIMRIRVYLVCLYVCSSTFKLVPRVIFAKSDLVFSTAWLGNHRHNIANSQLRIIRSTYYLRMYVVEKRERDVYICNFN